jgi:hypothetical protein
MCQARFIDRENCDYKPNISFFTKIMFLSSEWRRWPVCRSTFYTDRIGGGEVEKEQKSCFFSDHIG